MPGWLLSGDGAVSQSPSKLSSVLPEATGACLTQTSCCQRHPQSQPEPALGLLKTRPRNWRPKKPAQGHRSLPPPHHQRTPKAAPTLPKHPGVCLRSPGVTGDSSRVALQDPSSLAR